MDKKRLLREAYNVASRSRDYSVQNGAIIWRNSGFHGTDGHIVCAESNNFPEGVLELPSRLKRPDKYAYVEHAERAAIYKAAKVGVVLTGCVMVCPWFACADCARAIILSGIRHVVGHKQMMDKTPNRWKNSIAIAHTMLTEAGVTYEFFDGVLNTGLKLRFDEELWTP